MISTIQSLENAIKRDYMESLALLKILKDNNGYEVASWFRRALHDNKKTRILIAKYLDLFDEYQKKCNL